LQCIDEYAFRATGLKKIEISSSVEFIGKYCFSECKFLYEVLFEAGSKLKRIDEYGFHGTGLNQIEIPSSVEFIGKHCFCGCQSLCVIRFEAGCKYKLQHLDEYGLDELRVNGTMS
jgi:hypothetical protein